MRASCVHVTNPFDPLGSRATATLRRRRRIRALAPRTSRPHIAVLNGRPIARVEWARKLADGDQLTFVVLPQGGGGGAGGSNPMRTILTLALIAGAPMLAGAGLSALGLNAGATLFGTYTLGQAATAAVFVAGSALINAAFPPPTPASIDGPSPTYTLAAQGNTARIDQSIPVQYGQVLSYPDFAAQPYAEFAGEDQYLYQLLCLGAGEFDVEDIRIEDTPISSFSEIETQIVGPGAQVTLFPTNVITSLEISGQEMPGRRVPTYTRSGTTVTFTEVAHGRVTGETIAVDFVGSGPNGVYQIVTVPNADTFTITTASGSGSGTAWVHEVLGGIDGYVASGPETVATRLGIDVVMPRGLYNNGSEISERSLTVRFEGRRLDDLGQPIGGWIELAQTTFEDRTTTPLRKSLSIPLATPGRYAVRAWRIDERSADDADGHEVLFAGLRSYLTEDQDFGPVTLIAIRMRATNNLSAQASRKIAVLATRRLPVWNGVSWSAPQKTASIAWALADATRNADYGAGLPDTRIDLAALLALDGLWTGRGDEFNGRFDQSSSWWDAAAKIAMAGRARIFLQGGVLRCVRDTPATVPVALFSMRNIVTGSFSIDYLLPSEETADAVEVSYFDRETWTTQRVTARLPGSAAEAPAKIELFGVTDRSRAYAEGLYQAAANKYRRRIVRFATEMEGFIPSIGDLIAVQHDTPGWGVHAEATRWIAVNRNLHLSEEVSFGEGAHYVGLRRPDGSLSGPWLVTPGVAPNIVVLAQTPDIDPSPTPDRERAHVVFGAGETWRTLAKVIGVTPRGLYEVEIEAVAEDPAVHIAETGQAPAPLVTSLLNRNLTRPVIAGLIVRAMPDDPTRAVLSWSPAPGATHYQIDMAHGADPDDPNLTWTAAAETAASNHALTLLYASQTLVRVRGIGLTAGPYVKASLGSLITFMWGGASDPIWTADANLMWSPS